VSAQRACPAVITPGQPPTATSSPARIRAAASGPPATRAPPFSHAIIAPCKSMPFIFQESMPTRAPTKVISGPTFNRQGNHVIIPELSETCLARGTAITIICRSPLPQWHHGRHRVFTYFPDSLLLLSCAETPPETISFITPPGSASRGITCSMATIMRLPAKL
jgi:hypothetical protein